MPWMILGRIRCGNALTGWFAVLAGCFRQGWAGNGVVGFF